MDIIIEKLERFIEEYNLQHGNSEVFEQDNEIYMTIEAPNHTTLTIVFNDYDMQLLKEDFNRTVKFKIRRRLAEFDIDDTFNELYSKEFAEHNGFTPRSFIRILEEDRRFFEIV